MHAPYLENYNYLSRTFQLQTAAHKKITAARHCSGKMASKNSRERKIPLKLRDNAIKESRAKETSKY